MMKAEKLGLRRKANVVALSNGWRVLVGNLGPLTHPGTRCKYEADFLVIRDRASLKGLSPR
jgi:hypothetical protein